MVIHTLEREYRVLHRKQDTEYFEILVCQNERDEAETYYTLLRFFKKEEIRWLLEQTVPEEEITGDFADYRESFIWNDSLIMVFLRKEGLKIEEWLQKESHPLSLRLEIGKRLLERLLMLNMPGYLLGSILNAQCILITEALEVAIRYEPSEIVFENQGQQENLSESFYRIFLHLFEEEEKGQPDTGIHSFLEQLRQQPGQDIFCIYQSYVRMQDNLEESKDIPGESGTLQQPLESFKGYVKLGKYYVAVKFVISLICLSISLVLIYIFCIQPALKSEFSIRTMMKNSFFFEGKLSGTGRENYENGTLKYEGEFAQGVYEGEGKLYGKNGIMRYEGEFAQGVYEGSGKLYDKNGIVRYEGEFKQGVYEGKGKLYDKNGVIKYEGEFVQGLYEGSGKLYDKNSVMRYQGDFVAGVCQGEGTRYDKKGNVLYQGGFANGSYEGMGMLFRGKTVIAQGEFKEGKFLTGTAILYNEKNIPIYEGEIVNGKKQGNGKQYEEETGTLIYDGTFAEGEYEGSGKLFDENTGILIYEGEFYHGSFHGNGKLYDKETQLLLYEGEFRLGLYDGEGILYDATGGKVYQGQFRLGRYHGLGRLYQPETGEMMIEGEFRNGYPLMPEEDSLIKEEIIWEPTK